MRIKIHNLELFRLVKMRMLNVDIKKSLLEVNKNVC